jgi:glycosyltransferase involved in cell wall biosynthesis
MSQLGAHADTVHTEFDFLTPQRYQAYLAAATVLVQPYRAASQSGNTAQAYRAGVPVVCTRVGGLPEMVEEGATGAVAEPGRDGLADAVVRVLRANARGAMAPKCRQLAEGRFSWPAIASATVEVYREAIRLRAAAAR